MKEFSNKEAKLLADFVLGCKDRGVQPPILFLGAGCSISAGLPSSKDFLTHISKDLQTDFATLEDLARLTPLHFRQLARKHFSEAKVTCSYDILAMLLALGYFDLILSTNWDVELEKALHKFLPPSQIRTFVRGDNSDEKLAEYVSAQDANTIQILKLHGDVSATPLFKRSDLLSFQGPLGSALNLAATRRGIIFLGYSFSEPRVFELCRNVKNCWFVNPKNPEDADNKFDMVGIQNSTTILAEDGVFDNFVSGLCFEVGKRRQELLERVDTQAAIKNEIEIAVAQLNAGAIDDNDANVMIDGLIRDIGKSFAKEHRYRTAICFIDDPSSPGGKTILERISKSKDLSAAISNFRVFTASISDRTGKYAAHRSILRALL